KLSKTIPGFSASGVALSVPSPRHAKRQAWLWAFHYNRSRSKLVVSIYKKNPRNKLDAFPKQFPLIRNFF
ncbi:MAG: hypothetical protein PSX36_12085, partial [bacterium]|nr:hypothetical protein [bacterium]